jgi:hypothetical protein
VSVRELSRDHSRCETRRFKACETVILINKKMANDTTGIVATQTRWYRWPSTAPDGASGPQFRLAVQRLRGLRLDPPGVNGGDIAPGKSREELGLSIIVRARRPYRIRVMRGRSTVQATLHQRASSLQQTPSFGGGNDGR